MFVNIMNYWFDKEKSNRYDKANEDYETFKHLPK